MRRFLLPVVLVCGAGCDAARPEPAEDTNPNVIEAEAGFHPQVVRTSWSQMTVCRAGSGSPDTLIEAGQSLGLNDPRGYRLGYWSVLFVKRGTGLVPVLPAYVPDNGALPRRSLLSDRQHDAGVAVLRLDSAARNVVKVDRFDPATRRMEGTFEARFVFHSGTPAPDPARNFPDTVAFRNGRFRIAPEVVPCAW